MLRTALRLLRLHMNLQRGICVLNDKPHQVACSKGLATDKQLTNLIIVPVTLLLIKIAT